MSQVVLCTPRARLLIAGWRDCIPALPFGFDIYKKLSSALENRLGLSFLLTKGEAIFGKFYFA